MPMDHEPVYRHDEPARDCPSFRESPSDARDVVPRRENGTAPLLPGLRTAAEMLHDGDTRPAVDPDLFRQGMVVLHPDFGLGKIVALGGSGGERTATVDFASAAARKKIALAEGALRPVK